VQVQVPHPIPPLERPTEEARTHRLPASAQEIQLEKVIAENRIRLGLARTAGVVAKLIAKEGKSATKVDIINQANMKLKLLAKTNKRSDQTELVT
jgi:hypothetical protein